MPYVKIQFLDNSGSPCAGCTLSSFSAGTSTPLATYVDAAGVTQNTNPIVLDSAGRANVWLGANSYKFVLKDANAVTIWTVDNVNNYFLLSRNNTWSGTQTFNGAVTFNGTVTLSNVTDIITKGPYIDIRAYGGIADGGVTDNTSALNQAITASCAAGGRPILFPAATNYYGFATKPNAIGCGAWILGQGNGTTNTTGTALVYTLNEGTPANGFLTWDGSYSSFKGTGGGINNLAIYKKTNNGGTALKITGSGDNNRAGFFTIRDVVVSASGGATWNKGLIVDGSCCTTSGGQGVRDIYIENFWPAVMSDGDTSIYFNNAVQVFWFGGEVFPASGGGSTGLTVTGNGAGTQASSNIFLNNVYFVGNVVIDYVSTFQASNTFVGGNFTSSANSNGCRLGGQIGGSITNTGNCELQTQTQWLTGAATQFKGSSNTFTQAVGVGGTASGAAAIYLTGNPYSGTSQYGVSSNTTFTQQATTFAGSFNAAPNTENASFTLPNLFDFYAGMGTKGAASTVTNFIGFGCANNLNFGGTSNWCLHTGTGNKAYVDAGLQISATGALITKVLSNTTSLDFAAWAGSDCQELGMTVTGAVDGDVVILGIPNALSSVAGVQFTGRVSSADTVIVRGCKVTAGASADPAAATIRATVIHF